MLSSKDTLVVPLSLDEKSVLRDIAKKRGQPLTKVVRDFLRYAVTTLEKRPWPAPSPDGRQKPKKVPPPLPKVEPLTPMQHLKRAVELIEAVTTDPSRLTAERFGLMEAHYGRAKVGILVEGISSMWALTNEHRALIEQGRDLPPDITPKNRRVVIALWHFERIRNLATKEGWKVRRTVDRAQLPPAKRQKINAEERKRQQLHRAKEAPKLEAERAAKKAAAERKLKAAEEEFCSDDRDVILASQTESQPGSPAIASSTASQSSLTQDLLVDAAE
jgi:hypothetical protein